MTIIQQKAAGMIARAARKMKGEGTSSAPAGSTELTMDNVTAKAQALAIQCGALGVSSQPVENLTKRLSAKTAEAVYAELRRVENQLRQIDMVDTSISTLWVNPPDPYGLKWLKVEHLKNKSWGKTEIRLYREEARKRALGDKKVWPDDGDLGPW